MQISSETANSEELLQGGPASADYQHIYLAETGESHVDSNARSQSELLRDPPPVAWLTKTDRWFLIVMLLLGTALGLANWIRYSGSNMKPVEIGRLNNQPYQYRVDVNDANWLELMLLDGVGETLAKRIVNHREQFGPFQQVEDLLEIKGIGGKRLAKLRSQVTCKVTQTQSITK